MSSVGKISLDLNINSKGFNKQVDGIQKQTTKAFGAMSVAVGNIMANLAAKAVASMGHFIKDSIAKGSELTELENVVESVFTTMADKVDTFAKNALDTYGLTEKQAKRMVGTFGAMSKSFGYSEAQAYGMSTALAGLAGDVASFYDLSIDEAYTKMKSVFTGETESLKELGVVMTQTALDEFALANGFGKTTDKMSEQEKVALRLAFVQDRLKTASGDVIRTQDSWANQMRKLTGQIDSFKTAIGQGLINVLTPVIKVINIIMAKLVQLANAFKSFTEMIMGKKNSGGAGAAMQEVADAAGEAAGATGGVEDAAEGAASAAKKAQKSLMGFDEINKLTKVDDSGAGGGSGVSFDDIAFGDAVAEQDNITNTAIENIKSKVLELIELFKQGFSAGLGADFENSIIRIKGHVEGIGQSLKEVFTDEGVVASASTMLDKIAYAFGQNIGSIASIGTSIAEMLVGGVDAYLDESKDFIKERLIGMLDVTGEYAEIAGNLSETIGSIFEVFRGDSAKQITGDLIGIVSNAALGMNELAMNIGKDVLNCIAQPIIDNKDKIKEALENTLEPIGTVVSTIEESVRHTFEKIFEVYDEYVAPAFEGIADGLSSIVSTFLDEYNSHIAPALDNLADKFSEVWQGHIQPAIDEALELVGKISEAIQLLWQNVLVPLVNWIVSNIIPVVVPIFESLGTTIMNLYSSVADVVSGVLEALGGLIDFLIGVFTGDWERAWTGIKDIFSGIWEAIKGIVEYIWEGIKGAITLALESIKGTIIFVLNGIKNIIQTIWGVIQGVVISIVNGIKTAISTAFTAMKNVIKTAMTAIKNTITTIFSGIWNFIKGIINTILGGIETMVNGVINGLNFMIGALNKLSFDIPSWVPDIGGEKFGFDIPTISSVSLPRLAEGGYVRANQPQPVIVGDNKTQGEIIAPEDKILALTLQALEQFFSRLKESGYSSEGNGDVGDIIIPIYLDGSMLDEVIVTAQQRRNLRSGGR